MDEKPESELASPVMDREQVRLVHKIVKLYGFQNLVDYETRVSAKTLAKIPDFLKLLSRHARDIDRLFPVHEINLRRTDYVVDNYTFAMNILRSLLTCIFVAWETIRTSDTIYVKLVPKDRMDDHYVQISALDSANEPLTSCGVLRASKVRPMIGDTDGSRNLACVEYEIPSGLREYILSMQLDGFTPGPTYMLVVGGQPVYIVNNMQPDGELLPKGVACFPAKYLVYSSIALRFMGVEVDRSGGVPDLLLRVSYIPGMTGNSYGSLRWQPLCGHDKPCHQTPTSFHFMSGIGGVVPNNKCSLHKSEQVMQDQGDGNMLIIPKYTVFSYSGDNRVMSADLDLQGHISQLWKFDVTGYALHCGSSGIRLIDLGIDLEYKGTIVSKITIRARPLMNYVSVALDDEIQDRTIDADAALEYTETFQFKGKYIVDGEIKPGISWTNMDLISVELEVSYNTIHLSSLDLPPLEFVPIV
jgi:hypothetical protein